MVFLNSEGNQTEDEVRWIEYDRRGSYLGIEGSHPNFSVNSGYENRSVVYVSWYGAAAFPNWLSEEKSLEKCYGEIGNRRNVDITKNGYRLLQKQNGNMPAVLELQQTITGQIQWMEIIAGIIIILLVIIMKLVQQALLAILMLLVYMI